MEIGDVLLRDAQYVWRERKALLRRDAVVLYVGKSARETFALDGRFTCEAVVVSSAHLHAVRLQDIQTGNEFLLDTRARGKKQVWVELFQNVRRLDAFQPLPSMRQLASSQSSDAAFDTQQQQLQDLLRTSTLGAAVGKFIRGADLAALIGDDGNVDWLGNWLVQHGVLERCCCACMSFSGGDFIYRVQPHDVDELLASDSSLRAALPATYHRSDSCLLTPVFEHVLQLFRQSNSSSVSGLTIVETCVRSSSVFNVRTAIAIANEMLRRGLLVAATISSTSDRQTFCMDRTSAYVAGQPLVVATESSAPASGPEPLPPSEDFRRVLAEYRQLEQRYNVLLAVLGAFCVLAGVDAFDASALPIAVKLAFAALLVAWLTLGDGSASLHINVCKRGQGRAVTAAFFAASADVTTSTAMAMGSVATNLGDNTHVGNNHQLPDSNMSKASSEMATKSDDDMRVAATAAALRSAETQARDARVHSFRLAVAQAASLPYDATRVYSDAYLLSVLSVQDRAFSYAVTKIAKCLEWRAQFGVDAITLADVEAQLTSGSMYWYGYDFENRPILWVRGRLKDWKHMAQRRDAEIKAHVFLLEVGSRELMPPGATTYTIVTDSAKLGPSHLDLRLMHGLLDTCVAHYPDRVGMVHAGPMTRFLTWVIPMLWPFLPVRLRHKVSFMHDCVKDLSKHMKTELIPKHMGGTADHVLRATPSSDPNNAMDVMFMIEQQRLRMQAITM